MMRRFLLLLLMVVFLSSVVLGTCTSSSDKTSYSPTETITAILSCAAGGEKNKPYGVTWMNETPTFNVYEIDNGTTPATPSQQFFETFTIPSDYAGSQLLMNFTGSSLTSTSFVVNVTNASTSALLFTDVVVGGKFLGFGSSAQAVVKNADGDLVSGGFCQGILESNDGNTTFISVEGFLVNGDLDLSFIMTYESFDENVQYKVEMSCFCGSDGSDTECINQFGVAVENKVGTTEAPFTTSTWLAFNEDPMPIVLQNGSRNGKSAFAGFEEQIFYLANVTDNKDIELKIVNTPFLVNNVTGEIFTDPMMETELYSVEVGNSSIVVSFEISHHASTGQYYIINFFDIFANNILVSQDIVKTEVFNVTGTADLLKINGVFANKDYYMVGEEVHICANLTNNFDERVTLEVLYDFRCSANISNDALKDRVVLGVFEEHRGLSAGVTQNQCVNLVITTSDHLRFKVENECVASVSIESPFIDTFDNKRSTTSSTFFITDIGLSSFFLADPDYPFVVLFPDWRFFDEVVDGVVRNYFFSNNINITLFNESRVDPNGKIADDDWDVYLALGDDMPCSRDLFNYSVTYNNGSVVANEVEAKVISWASAGVHRQNCVIGVENINFSDALIDVFDVTVWFENYDERGVEAWESMNFSADRSALALEGIENKTGTFHFSVACPSSVASGDSMDCVVSAQVEDSQLVEKETDFTCYIVGDEGEGLSSQNFNQMVNRTLVDVNVSVLVPSSLSTGSHTFKCEAGYYNLGSRVDTFFDSFVVTKDSSVGFISAFFERLHAFRVALVVLFTFLAMALLVVLAWMFLF